MNSTHYFNLYTSGLGYLNRIREVTPKKANRSCVCDIAALRGEASNAEHTGSTAASAVRKRRNWCTAIDACEQRRKVLIQFRLGDLYRRHLCLQQRRT